MIEIQSGSKFKQQEEEASRNISFLLNPQPLFIYDNSELLYWKTQEKIVRWINEQIN